MQITEEAKIIRNKLVLLSEELEKKLQKVVEGRLEVSKNHNSYQYYLTQNVKPHKRLYLNKSRLNLAEKIAERDYYSLLLVNIKKNLYSLDAFIRSYKPQELINCYTRLSPARQKLIKPLFLSDIEYAQIWQARKFKQKKEEANDNLLTMKDELVRSKSELIIADFLKAHDIPYHYEYPLKLKNGNIIYPDFFCLNPRTRQEFFWEHCGLMTNPTYSKNLIKRLREYSKLGIMPGKNLILTMECEESPLSTKELEVIIKSFLK